MAKGPSIQGTAPGLAIPERVGGYRIEETLGQGGMGVVYRATAPDGSPVALKVVRPELVGEAVSARFARESAIQLDHPNVVRVLEADEDEQGLQYLAMELLVGESLRERIDRERIEPATLLEHMAQVCSGLEAAHGAGLVHRDLKPDNIFLCDDGTVKILDFGVARVRSARTMTAAGTVLGTLSYLSPEQARGDRLLDERSDLWALGVIIYEALAGQAPFDRETDTGTLLAIIADRPPRLDQVVPDVPQALARLVHRCLEKQPDDRHRSAVNLREALREIEAERGSGVRLAPQDAVGSSLRVSLSPHEQRLVAVLIARGVHDAPALEAAVRLRGGEAVSLVGDEVIGVFGTLHWEGDEVASAVNAGLEARTAAEDIAVGAGLAHQRGTGISGAGVSAAEAALRTSVSGVALHRDAARAVENRFLTVPVRDDVWEVIRERKPDEDPGRYHAPLVGRRDELRELHTALAAASLGASSQSILILGPPGIGKSRLCRELGSLASVYGDRIRVFYGRAHPGRGSDGLALFASALRHYILDRHRTRGWPRVDRSASVADKRAVLHSLAEEAFGSYLGSGHDPDTAELLGDVLALGTSGELDATAFVPDVRVLAERSRVAVVDYFLELSGKWPTVLLLDDLHHADAVSLAVLEELLLRSGERSLLVVATARPAARDRLSHRFDTVRELPPLGADECEELADYLSQHELSRALREQIGHRAEGNPLFVEQLVLHVRDGDSKSIPLGVQATLQQRLDQLTPDERDACRHLAVLGRSCRWEELHAFAPTTATPVVDSLVRKGILRDSDIDGAPAVELSGSLLQQVAYDTITPEARARLHSEAARTLEALPGISAHEIALHFDRAGEPSAAVEHYVRATRDALKWGDADTALRCADRALDLGAAGPLRLELHLARAEAFQFTGQREAQRQALDEAFPLAQRAADRARVLTEQASWLARAGDFQQAIAVAQKALDAARSSESPRAIALASGRWALSLVFAGRAEEGESLVREASRAAREHGDPLLMAEAAEWRALQAASVGDLGEARRAFEAAVELFRDGGDRRRAAVNENNLADMHNRVGSYAEAERSLAEAIAYFQHSANRPSEAYAQLNRAYSQLARGAVDEALLSLGRSEELAAELRDARLDVALRLYRAKALLAQGDWGLAASLAARAAAEAERAGQAGLWVNAMTVEAWARLRSHDPAAAADKARAALERRDELGGVEEDEADVFLAYASALEALGRTEEAATVRERGRSRLRYVAARIRNAELRRCLLEDVPSHAALLAGPTVR